MYNILVADDEENIRTLIKKYAQYEGYNVDESVDGLDTVDKVKHNNYDMLVLDVMMPELDGFSVTRELRKFSDIPIIMLSARSEEYDRIHGFEAGVDDYVVKPFSPRELILRIEAIIKRYRANGVDQNRDVFVFDTLKVDFSARIVYIDNERVNLSPKECELLFYMIKNKDLALTRERLIEDIWGYDFDRDDRTLDTHIKLLRKNMGKYADMIVTIRGVGYRFETRE